MKNKVFIMKAIPKLGVELLISKGLEVSVWEQERPPSKTEIIENSRDCFAIVPTVSNFIDDEIIKECKQLKIIANIAVGFNNIQLSKEALKNIVVTNTPDVLTEATAELALSLLMACNRNLYNANLDVRQGKWKNFEPMGHLGIGLNKATLGVFGMGAIGAHMARLGQALGMNIIYSGFSGEKQINFPARYVSLDELLKHCDFLSIHCKLTKDSKHLFNYERLKQMKKEAVLINTARGEIIKEEDLIKILNEKKLRAVGLDVTEKEPLATNSPLLNFPNVFITPHIGSATKQARDNMSLLVAQNIVAIFEKKPVLTPVSF